MVSVYSNNLNKSITLSTPTFIKGKNSGATAFLKDSVNDETTLTIYQVSGSFIKNESLIFDGIENGRIITDISKNNISSVKSLFGTTDGVVGINTFSADTIQSVSSNVGIATISEFSGGISTVRSSNPSLLNNVSEGDLLQYTDLSTSPDPIVSKIVSIDDGTLSIVGVTTVSGIVSGKLPDDHLNITDLKILKTKLSESSDNTLFTRLGKNNEWGEMKRRNAGRTTGFEMYYLQLEISVFFFLCCWSTRSFFCVFHLHEQFITFS